MIPIPAKPWTDGEIARMVEAAKATLNEALRRAFEAGLRADISVEECRLTGSREGQQSVRVDLLRPVDNRREP
jgi:hypothetical protein